MTTKTIVARTEIGTFTRRTANAYTHIIVNVDTKEALRWSGNANASEAKNAKVVADGIRYFQKLGDINVAAYPILTAAVPDAHDSGDHAQNANPFCMKCSADKAAQAERASETTIPLGAAWTPEECVERLNGRRAAEAAAAAPEATGEASQSQLDELQQAHEQNSLLTRDEARALVGQINVRQVGKTLVHDIKADRKDDTLARTLCGVPINGAAQQWLVSMDTVNCHTCRQAAAKAALGNCPEHGTDKKATCLSCHRTA